MICRKHKDNQKYDLERTLNKLYRCRDMEITNLWQRSIFLAVFLTLTLSGYGILASNFFSNNVFIELNYKILHGAAVAIGLLGFTLSVIWVLMAKGSKAWYEVYAKAISDFEEEFKDVFTCAKHVRENFIDITLKGVTKGDAITELIEKLGIDKKDTYAFGDADNDVEMMQAVGTGIAMGRHSEKVGEVASMVTGTVKEEGITMALKKLGLI